MYTDWIGGVAYLTGPTLNLPVNRSYCLTFFYYFVSTARRPDRSASLSVTLVRHRDDSTGTRPDWSRQSLGNAGRWRPAEVSFELGTSLQIMFAVDLAGVNGSAVALDDISVVPGDCSGGENTFTAAVMIDNCEKLFTLNLS